MAFSGSYANGAAPADLESEPPRVAIGGISHETNTFAPTPTRMSDFRDYLWLTGDEIPQTLTNTRTYVGGMLHAASELGLKVVPTFLTTAQPAGVIVGADFNTMLAQLLRSIEASQPVDGVCLELHGAGVAEDCDDVEGRILEEVRRLTGPSMPIVATLDLHGNLTPAMVEHSNGLFGVHHYPHIDTFETGSKAMRFVAKLIARSIRPVTHVEWLPMMLASMTTERDPLRSLRLRSEEWEQRTSILDCTVFHGFPMTDVPAVGVSIHAISDGDIGLAWEAATDVAKAMWDARGELLPDVLDPADAVSEALRERERQVIINETSDNPGGGSPGDSTHLLRALVEADVQDCCFGFLWDPDSVRQAIGIGVGGTGPFLLGGKSQVMSGEPVRVEAYVKAITDGVFTYETPMLKGTQAELGPMVRLQVGGMDLLVSSRRQQVFDPEVFLLNGIDVRRYRIIALKSAHHFRAGFVGLDARIVTADALGLTSQRIERLGHRRLRRPIWPLDAGVAYIPSDKPPPGSP